MNNNPKLKLAMARLLPEKIGYHTRVEGMTEPMNIYWMDNSRELLETEWLYVMHLIEEVVATYNEQVQYAKELALICYGGVDPMPSSLHGVWLLQHATFNQRATAMCKVKGIEV
jgi:hypothetical protein